MKPRHKKSKKVFQFLILFSIFCFLFSVLLGLSIGNEVLAHVTETPHTHDIITLANPLCEGAADCEIIDIIKSIAAYLVQLGTVIVAIMVLIGGFQILTAGGSPEKVTTGKHTILYSVIGYAIILSAFGIVNIIKELLQ